MVLIVQNKLGSFERRGKKDNEESYIVSIQANSTLAVKIKREIGNKKFTSP